MTTASKVTIAAALLFWSWIVWTSLHKLSDRAFMEGCILASGWQVSECRAALERGE